MLQLLKTQLGQLRVIAFLEGVSYLVILFITMPMKYMMDMPGANKAVGMVHGILFVIYVVAVIRATAEFSWGVKKTLLALLASIIPFGTFWADSKIFKQQEQN